MFKLGDIVPGIAGVEGETELETVSNGITVLQAKWNELHGPDETGETHPGRGEDKDKAATTPGFDVR